MAMAAGRFQQTASTARTIVIERFRWFGGITPVFWPSNGSSHVSCKFNSEVIHRFDEAGYRDYLLGIEIDSFDYETPSPAPNSVSAAARNPYLLHQRVQGVFDQFYVGVVATVDGFLVRQPLRKGFVRQLWADGLSKGIQLPQLALA